MYVQSLWRFLKEYYVWFPEKYLRRFEENSLKHSIVLPNDNFLEKELETFNRDEVGNEEPLVRKRNRKHYVMKIHPTISGSVTFC